MWPVAIDVTRSVVCVSVSVLVTLTYCATKKPRRHCMTGNIRGKGKGKGKEREGKVRRRGIGKYMSTPPRQVLPQSVQRVAPVGRKTSKSLPE